MAVDHTTHVINYKGNGTVVLIGSLGAIQEMREPQVAAPSKKYRTVAPDVRGHGESPTPEGEWDMSHLVADLIEVLNEEGANRAHLVGLSLGDAIAQTIVLEHADRVVSLALSSTAPKFGTLGAWQGKAGLMHDKGTVVLTDTIVRSWFASECFDTTPELPAHFRDMIADCPDDDYIGTCGALSRFDTCECLTKIIAPTLVTADRQDTSAPFDVVTSLHDGIESSTMVVISPAKHLLNQETPKYPNSALLAYIDGIAGQRLITAVENKK